MVWFTVVIAIHGALVTYDEPDATFVRVSYLGPFSRSPGEREGGWFEDPASSKAEAGGTVDIACDELYKEDGQKQKQNGHWTAASLYFAC